MYLPPSVGRRLAGCGRIEGSDGAKTVEKARRPVPLRRRVLCARAAPDASEEVLRAMERDPGGDSGQLARSSLSGEPYETLFADLLPIHHGGGGCPVSRAHFSTATLHPMINAVGITWLSRQRSSPRRTSSMEAPRRPFGGRVRSSTCSTRRSPELRVPLLEKGNGPEVSRLRHVSCARPDGLIAFLIDFGWSADHLPTGNLGMIVSFATAVPPVRRPRPRWMRSVCPALAAAVKSRVFPGSVPRRAERLSRGRRGKTGS